MGPQNALLEQKKAISSLTGQANKGLLNRLPLAYKESSQVNSCSTQADKGPPQSNKGPLTPTDCSLRPTSGPFKPKEDPVLRLELVS